MARPKRGEILSLTIDDLAFGGEGVGRADGYVVFVPGGLPGDRLRVRLVQVRSRFGRGVIDAIEEPSPQRVEAPCPYFGRCGGCRLQHMAYPAQLAFKAKQVVDALERLGGLKGIEVRPIIGATETFGYRNKMEFTVARGAKEPLVVGLHEADRYDSVLDIERCLLQSDRMNALLGEARAFFVERGLTVYEQDSGEGLLRFLMLREGTHTGELMANVVTSAPAVSELAPLAPRLQAPRRGHDQRGHEREPQEGQRGGRRRGAPAGRPRPHPRARGRAHLPGLGQLVLPDQYPAGRAPLRARASTPRA